MGFAWNVIRGEKRGEIGIEDDIHIPDLEERDRWLFGTGRGMGSDPKVDRGDLALDEPSAFQTPPFKFISKNCSKEHFSIH